MFNTINGKRRKGSDYLWTAFQRQLEHDPEILTPSPQANFDRDRLLAFFRSDHGNDPMAALDLHLKMANRYGQDMLALQHTPQSVLQDFLNSSEPLHNFMATLDQVDGYKEDPLRGKKQLTAPDPQPAP